MESGTPLLHPAAAEEPAAREGRLSTFGAAAMLTCWSTASCNLLYPWLYGVAGVVSGPALQLAMQLLTTWVAVRMCDAARVHARGTEHFLKCIGSFSFDGTRRVEPVARSCTT